MLNATITPTELSRAIPYARYECLYGTVFDERASALLGAKVWRVRDTFKFHVCTTDQDGDVWAVVPEGYLSDGSSIPSIVWSWFPAWKQSGRAAIMHNYLIEHGEMYAGGRRAICSQTLAHQVFRLALIEEGATAWQARVMYNAVRLWGIIRPSRKFGYSAIKRTLEREWEFGAAKAL